MFNLNEYKLISVIPKKTTQLPMIKHFNYENSLQKMAMKQQTNFTEKNLNFHQNSPNFKTTITNNDLLFTVDKLKQKQMKSMNDSLITSMKTIKEFKAITTKNQRTHTTQ